MRQFISISPASPDDGDTHHHDGIELYTHIKHTLFSSTSDDGDDDDDDLDARETETETETERLKHNKTQ